MGRQLLDAADLDGAEPDDRPGRNELRVHRNLDGTGSIHGVFDDPAAFAPILTALDARTRPSAENRGATVAEKNAAALVEICEFALGYQHDGMVAGERPHVTVTIGLAELEARARGALLDMGGELTPGQLRRMLCDARIVRSCSVSAANPSMSAAPNARSPIRCAGSSRPATAAARIPGVIDHRAGAKCTT